MAEFDSANSINQGTHKTLQSSKEKTQRSSSLSFSSCLSLSSSSSLSFGSSSMNYDHCCIIANEKSMIEEHVCELDEYLECAVCCYETKFEVDARIWEEKIAKLISDDYNEDHWTDVELRGKVSGKDDSDLEKTTRNFSFS